LSRYIHPRLASTASSSTIIITIIMSSTTYNLDCPRWLWEAYKRGLQEIDTLDRINDRLVPLVAVDVTRFDEAGLVDLDETERQRLELLLEASDQRTAGEAGPALPLPTEDETESEAPTSSEAETTDHGGSVGTDGRRPTSSASDPRGDRR